jgi:tetratricopeptide (TPR) repeat protein
MFRLVGFFILVFVVLNVLREVLAPVPILGAVLGVPLLGFWIVALGLSWVLSRFASNAVDRSRQRSLVRTLGAVETPHNQGKLGSLLIQQGRYKRALKPLQDAVRGEPSVAEWHYRLGQAKLKSKDLNGASQALLSALAIDEEYAYGAALMQLAEAELLAGREESSLQRLEQFERNHGPSPESAYRRGKAHRKAGRKDAAQSAFDEVAELARTQAKYQKKQGGAWVFRAQLARWFG